MGKFYAKSAIYIFTKIVVLSIIIVLLLSASILFFYSIYAQTNAITFGTKAVDKLFREDSFYYFNTSFYHNNNTEGQRYEELKSLNKLSQICYQEKIDAFFQGKNYTVNAISEYVYSNLQLPLCCGEHIVDKNDEDITYGITYFGSGLDIGDKVNIGGGKSIIITGIMSKNTPLFSMSGIAEPMTTEAFFQKNGNNSREILCSNEYINNTQQSYSGSVIINFEKDITKEELEAAYIYLSNYGVVEVFSNIYTNNVKSIKNTIIMLLPFILSLSVMLVLLIIATIIYLLKKCVVFLRILLVLGAQIKHIFIIVFVYEIILLLVAIVVGIPLSFYMSNLLTAVSLGVAPYFVSMGIISAVYFAVILFANTWFIYKQPILMQREENYA